MFCIQLSRGMLGISYSAYMYRKIKAMVVNQSHRAVSKKVEAPPFRETTMASKNSLAWP
jgi:hypothetical protein